MGPVTTKRELPRSYFPIFFLGMLVVMVLAGALAATLDLNPYVAMAIAGGFWTLREVWMLKRKGY